MYCRKITYTDFFDNKREEEFFFNLSKSELIKFLQTNGSYSLDKLVKRLTQENNNQQLIEIFEKLIKLSYGKPSLDGRRFEKTDEIWQDFRDTNAYDALFLELIGNADKAYEWLSHVISQDIMTQALEEIKKNPNGVPDELRDYLPKGTIPERKGIGTSAAPLFPNT